MRNRIWRYTLVSADPVDVSDRKTPEEPGLLAVSKQVRAEALEIYYAENVSFFKCMTGNNRGEFSKLLVNRCTRWFQCIGRKRAGLIQKVLIENGAAVGHVERTLDSFFVGYALRYLRAGQIISRKAEDIIDRLGRFGIRLTGVEVLSTAVTDYTIVMWMFIKEKMDQRLESKLDASQRSDTTS